MNVQLPVADLRSLIGSATGRILRPSWPDPEVGQEFVQGVGAVRSLPGAGMAAPGWRGERTYIDASRLVRFTPDWFDRSAVWIKPTHRRLLGAGIAWRVDLGMVVKWREGVGPRTANALATRVLGLPIRIGELDRSLAESGRVLTTELLARTTHAGHVPDRRWMVAGRPLVLINEYAIGHGTLKIVTAPVSWNNRPMSVFVLRRGAYYSSDVRGLRHALWRAYQELETLRLVLRAWRSQQVEFDPKRLRDYLAPQLKLLSKRARDTYDQPTLLGIAAEASGFDVGDLEALAVDLGRESKGIVRSLKNVITTLEVAKRERDTPKTINFLSVQWRARMQGDSYTFHDKAAGVFGHDNSVSGGTFTAGDTSVSALDELLTAIAGLKAQLAPERAEFLEEAAQELRATDDPRRVETILERIGGIAALAGTAGTAVIEAVQSVAGALGIGR
ncbi:hypothetical protein ACIBG8_22580 [Nonomuraea sp. NPDC050556]|uniref:hypothetical protein n=1 Tax=Nonomuraea sp. NPDC050556 TaxID=3364369 RepID=UPI003790BBC4